MPYLMLYIRMYTVSMRESSGDDDNYPHGEIRGGREEITPHDVITHDTFADRKQMNR